jgi:hypothetical protein
MNKKEFEKVFAAAAEKSGVAGMTRDYQLAENLQSMMIDLRDKLYPTEQPSEGLEKAADYYLDNAPTAELMCGSYDGPDVYNAFVAGANWQKEQMLKNVVLETVVMKDDDGDGIETPYEEWLTLENTEIPSLPENIDLKDGDKVKILIIKEDEQ